MKTQENRGNTPQKKQKISKHYKRNKHGYNYIIKAFNDEIEQAKYLYNF